MTEEGQQAWFLVERGGGQLRSAGMGGIVGFDLPALLALGDAYGFDRQAMAHLLPFAEAGMVAALARRGREGAGGDGPDDDEMAE